VSPPSGTSGPAGAAQAFTVAFTDAAGWADVSAFNVVFGGTSNVGACYLTAYPGINLLVLWNDAGTAYTSGYPGSAGVLSNSQCSVDLSTTHVTGDRITLTFTVSVTFTSAFAGTREIYALGVNSANQYSPWVDLGSWNVMLAYSIGGQVTSSGAGLSGVTMILNGAQSINTDGSGRYSFIGLPAGGSYTVSASKAGYTLSVSQTFNNLSANQTANFTASPILTTITTSPIGLPFTVDGTAYSSSQTFQWLPLSTHTVGVLTPPAQYVFSSWSDNPSASHTITVPNSSSETVAYFTLETITQATLTGGPSNGPGGTGIQYAFTAAASSSFSHVLQYQFTWGDGTATSWQSSPAATKTWSSPGSYPVTVQARCANESSVVSAYSAAIGVVLGTPDFGISISPPDANGAGASPTVYLVPQFGFAGPVQLGATCPACVAGSLPSVQFNLATLPNFASWATTMNVTAPRSGQGYQTGAWDIVVSGYYGPTNTTRTAAFHFAYASAQDFTINVTPPSTPITAGQSGTYSVSANAVNGLDSGTTVTLTFSALPFGAAASTTVL